MRRRISATSRTWEVDITETADEEAIGHDSTTEESPTLASISGVPKYTTFRMRGVLQG
jgi:hypothetical protein